MAGESSLNATGGVEPTPAVGTNIAPPASNSVEAGSEAGHRHRHFDGAAAAAAERHLVTGSDKSTIAGNGNIVVRGPSALEESNAGTPAHNGERGKASDPTSDDDV